MIINGIFFKIKVIGKEINNNKKKLVFKYQTFHFQESSRKRKWMNFLGWGGSHKNPEFYEVGVLFLKDANKASSIWRHPWQRDGVGGYKKKNHNDRCNNVAEALPLCTCVK